MTQGSVHRVYPISFRTSGCALRIAFRRERCGSSVNIHKKSFGSWGISFPAFWMLLVLGSHSFKGVEGTAKGVCTGSSSMSEGSLSEDEVVREGVADPPRMFFTGGKGVSAPPRRE